MFYEPGRTAHGLPRDPFKSCVVPRPIGWISTRSAGEEPIDNLAPYSQFNNLSFSPPYVMFAANQDLNGSMKDTTRNAQDSGHFGWSMATFALRDAVNASAESVGPEVDEFLHAGVEKQEARVIPVSLVKASPIKFECKYYTTLRLPGDTAVGSVDVVIGRVVAVHVEDWALRDGQVDLGAIMPIARCGYLQYTVIKADSLFEMSIPGDPRMNDGLAGDEALVREWDPKGRRSDHAR